MLLWTYLVQPHPRDEGLFLLADASNQTGIEGGRDEGGHVLGAGSSLEHFQVEGVVVAGLHRQQLSLLQAGGVLRGVVHHWKIIGREILDGVDMIIGRMSLFDHSWSSLGHISHKNWVIISSCLIATPPST